MPIALTLEQAMEELEDAARSLDEWRKKQRDLEAKTEIVKALQESLLPVCLRCNRRAELTPNSLCWDCREELSDEAGDYEKV